MPICITCSTPVKHLYTTYSKADDRSLGKGVRLTQCPRCKRFADKYVEHDFVVLFIDLVLIKPQVYRHLLFNRLGRSDSKLDPSILRLGTLLILFDVYLTWARIEGAALKASSLDDAPILTQYLFFLTLKVLATTAQHVTVRMLVKFFVTGRDGVGGQPSPMPPAEGSPGKDDGANGTRKPESPHPGADAAEIARPRSTSPAAITTALLVSSCTKLFPILLEIWSGDDEKAETKTFNATFASRASTYVGWAVLLNNIEALLILLDCGYIVATGLAVAGAGARYVVEKMVLGAVGLEGDGMAAPIKTFGSIASRTGKLLGVG